MTRYTPSRDEVNMDALAAQRRCESEEAIPTRAEEMHEWRSRMCCEIRDELKELDRLLNPMYPSTWQDFDDLDKSEPF